MSCFEGNGVARYGKKYGCSGQKWEFGTEQ